MKKIASNKEKILIIFSIVSIYGIIARFSLYAQNFQIKQLSLTLALFSTLLSWSLPIIIVYLITKLLDQKIDYNPLYFLIFLLTVAIKSDLMSLVFIYFPNFGYHQLESNYIFSFFTLITITFIYYNVNMHYLINIKHQLFRALTTIICLLFITIFSYYFSILLIILWNKISIALITNLNIPTDIQTNLHNTIIHLLIWFNSIFIFDDTTSTTVDAVFCLNAECLEKIISTPNILLQNLVLIPFMTFIIYLNYKKNNLVLPLYLIIIIVGGAVLFQINGLFYLLLSLISIPYFLFYILLEIINTLVLTEFSAIISLVLIIGELVLHFFLFPHFFKVNTFNSNIEEQKEFDHIDLMIKKMDFMNVQKIDLKQNQIIITCNETDNIDINDFPQAELVVDLLIIHYFDDQIYSDYRNLCFQHYIAITEHNAKIQQNFNI